MQLVAPLASGITGAEGGVAQLFARSADTRMAYYRDFAGTIRVGNGGDLELDAYGSATVYVSELTRVVVKDQGGNTVRTFVTGESGSALELSTASFTGRDYATGAVAVSKPTTPKAALDSWISSVGATGPDFKYVKNTVVQNFSTLGSGIYDFMKLIVNVKSFGAGGAALTDDSRAIGLAIEFAARSGGIVFFPHGTYVVTSTIVVPGGVTLLGQGAGCSTIRQDQPTRRALSIQSTSATAVIKNLTIRYINQATGSVEYGLFLIDVLPGSIARFEGCALGGGVGINPAQFVFAVGARGGLDEATELHIDRCDFFYSKVAYCDFRRTLPRSVPVLRRCKFVAVNQIGGFFYGGTAVAVDTAYGVFDRCVWDHAFVNLGPIDQVAIGAADTTIITGASTATNTAQDGLIVATRCTFTNPNQGYVDAYLYENMPESFRLFTDRAARGGAVQFHYRVTDASLLGAGDRDNASPTQFPGRVKFGEAEARVYRVTSNVANILLPDIAQASTTIVTRTTSANQDIFIPVTPIGAVFRLFINNASGGTITLQSVFCADLLADGLTNGAVGVSMATGTWRLWEWVVGIRETDTFVRPGVPRRFMVPIADGKSVGSPT